MPLMSTCPISGDLIRASHLSAVVHCLSLSPLSSTGFCSQGWAPAPKIPPGWRHRSVKMGPASSGRPP
jgi:hypothetical protein